MTWHIEIDGHQCMASGMCAGIAPELFALDDDHARPLHPDGPADERALDAADACPAMAITVTEGEEVIGPRS
ncbi:ferredoxin [Streptantibioticus ferralitis]|uniref:Ferredoxin n=1 Tax=Streptantibioticus ferralitis TaxID=236510 RepID=A0ABT5YTB3_9ACTN|nr:ferredoxin [Streptantibioticus ferralitis]MDF2254846.1 ferredoxin [Streptantibioticus ferralitis]